MYVPQDEAQTHAGFISGGGGGGGGPGGAFAPPWDPFAPPRN